MPEEKPIDATEADAVQRVLEANGLEAEQVLVMLMKTLVGDQVRAEAGKTGKRSAAVESNALQCVLAALMEQLDQSRRAYAKRTARAVEKDASLDDRETGDPQFDGEQIRLQESVFEMTISCLAIAEHQAEMEKQERARNPQKDAFPRMRIVE